MGKFDAATFETVQRLVYPLVDTLFDFNPAEFVGDKAELFSAIAEAMSDVSTLFFLAADALTDGILSEEEIAGIIAQAGAVIDAVSEISNRILSFPDDEKVVE